MRPSGTHLYERVCPSVSPSDRPSVRPSITPVQKPAVFGHGAILHWIEMIDKHVLSASFTTQSIHLSVRPSVSLFMSHIQYTHRHSPDASLPGRACFFTNHFQSFGASSFLRFRFRCFPLLLFFSVFCLRSTCFIHNKKIWGYRNKTKQILNKF